MRVFAVIGSMVAGLLASEGAWATQVNFQFMHGYQNIGTSNPVYSERGGFGVGNGSVRLSRESGILQSQPFMTTLAGQDLDVSFYVYYSEDFSTGLKIPADQAIARVFVGYSINGAAPREIEAKDFARQTSGAWGSAKIAVPAQLSGKIQVWARFERKGGESVYVSNDSRNYELDILDASGAKGIHFEKRDWAGNYPVRQEGLLRAGGTLFVSYDPWRMSDLGLKPTVSGNYSTTIVYVSFRGAGGEDLLTVSWWKASTQAVALKIPEGTASVAMWARGEGSNVVHDSKFGQNYVFPTE